MAGAAIAGLVTAACRRPVALLDTYGWARLFLAGVRRHTRTVGTHRMHYQVAGPAQGPAVVLVHGLSGRAQDWQSLLPFLTRAGFRVYLPDLQGFGRSGRPQQFSYGISAQAGALLSLADALELREFDLGGWSMGGWIVQELAALHPERVRRLVLFDSAGIRELPQWDTALFTPENSTELQALLGLLMPRPPQVPAFLTRDLLRMARRNRWVVRRALESMLAEERTSEVLLPEVQAPTLIVWGDADRIFPPAHAAAMQRLVPGAEVLLLAGCGHLLVAQCAAQLAPPLIRFLQQS